MRQAFFFFEGVSFYLSFFFLLTILIRRNKRETESDSDGFFSFNRDK
jgi:hypothetical protein